MKNFTECILILILLLLPSAVFADDVNENSGLPCDGSFIREIIRDDFSSETVYQYDNTNSFFTVHMDTTYGNSMPSRYICSNQRFIAPIGTDICGVVCVQVDILLDQCISSATDTVRFDLYDGTGNAFCAGIHCINGIMNMIYYDVDGTQCEKTLFTVTPEKWYNLSYRITPNGEIALFIDGKRSLADTKMYVNPQSPDVQRIFTVDNRHTQCTVYIDNLLVYEDLLYTSIPFSDGESTGDITIPQYTDTGLPISWKSDRPDVLSADGKATAQLEDTPVRLTAFVSDGESKEYRVYYREVCGSGLKGEYDLGKEIDFQTQTDITESVILPHFTVNGQPIVWISSDTDLVTADGVVTRPYSTTPVTLTAQISQNGYKKDYLLTVKGYSEMDGFYCSDICATVNDSTVSKEENGDTVSFSAKLYNGCATEKSVLLLLVSYERETNRLVSVKSNSYTLAAKQEVDVSDSLKTNCSTLYTGVFLWEDGSLRPIYDFDKIYKFTPAVVYAVLGGGAVGGGICTLQSFNLPQCRVKVQQAQDTCWYDVEKLAVAVKNYLPLLAFGNRAQAQYQTDIGLIDYTSMSGSPQSYIGTPLYDNLLERLRLCMNNGARIGAILLHESETNAAVEPQPELLPIKTAQLVNQIRKDLAMPSLPVAVSICPSVSEDAIAAMASLKNLLPYCTIVRTDDLKIDDAFRFDAQSLQELGNRYFEAVTVNEVTHTP